jgi:hypothetical protein
MKAITLLRVDAYIRGVERAQPVALLPGEEAEVGETGSDIFESGDEGLGQPRDPGASASTAGRTR